MENVREIMFKWLLNDTLRDGELTINDAKGELIEVMENDIALDMITQFFRSLMDECGNGGYEATHKLFIETVNRYPNLTRVLTIYVYC